MEVYQEKDILLLASDIDELNKLWSSLINTESTLKGRITGEFECEEALKAILRSDYRVNFILPKNSSAMKKDCLATELTRILHTRPKGNGLKIVLEDDFYKEVPDNKIILFDYKNKLVKIRKRHFFEKKYRYRKAIIRTLFDMPPVYISYRNTEEIRRLINHLVKIFKLLFPHIDIKFDRQDVQYRDNVSKYIESLVNGKNIIFLINDTFFESEYCMRELLDVIENAKNFSELREKIYPIITDSGKCIYDAVKMTKFEKFWKNKRNEVIEALKESSCNGLNYKLHFIDKVIANLQNITDTLNKFYYLDLETHRESNFFVLFWQINMQLAKDNFVSFYFNEDEMKNALDSIEILTNQANSSGNQS